MSDARNSHEAFAEWFDENIEDIYDIEKRGSTIEEAIITWCNDPVNKHEIREDGVYNLRIEEDNCPHCGDDRGDHDISDRNRLIPCESDGEGEFELKLCRTAGLW